MIGDLHPPIAVVSELVTCALREDLTPLGDITGNLLPPGATAEGEIISGSEGVLAGCLPATESFAQVDRSVTVEWLSEDGTEVSAGDVLARVQGPLASILAAERTSLNFLTHLSGIASLTRRYVRAAQNKTRIRDTRKTTPGMRILEKAAVRAGGGVNHRGSLSDAILIKDNHLSAIAVADLVRRARMRWPGRTIEVECENQSQLREALDVGVDMILFDNMSPEEVEECVKIVEGRCPVEVSGNVTLQSVGAYAKAGADYISVGAITHSAPDLDIKLELKNSAADSKP